MRIYLPNSDVTMRGIQFQQHLELHEIRLQQLPHEWRCQHHFKQTEAACDSIGVAQWFEAEPYRSQQLCIKASVVSSSPSIVSGITRVQLTWPSSA